ncbi:V-type ATP synthase subunit K [bacterium]|nr:V-type ATP synthase subunit K [bacterium]
MTKKLTLAIAIIALCTVAAAFAQDAPVEAKAGWFNWDAGTLALIGVGIAVVLAGFGSAIGIGIAANMSIGAMHEHPGLFPQFLLLSALPGTQGIYGFVAGFLIILWTGLLNDPSALAALTPVQGWHFLFAGVPVGLAGLVSGIHQGKVCASGVGLVVRDKANVAKAMTLAAFVEFYAILGLLASVLILLSIK